MPFANFSPPKKHSPRTPGISPIQKSRAPDFSPSTRVESLRPHFDDFATSPGALGSGWVGVVIGLQVEGDEKIHGKMLGKIIGLPGKFGEKKILGTSATKLKL